MVRPTGSSPRGRGTPPRSGGPTRSPRFIPAWAGNTSQGPRSRHARPVHPRVGGEHYQAVAEGLPRNGSSPRGRGTLLWGWWCCVLLRFIPAWAGNTSSSAAIFTALPVHPRVGGEHFLTVWAVAFFAGSSPRGRGTRILAADDPRRLRFIPAWAGNTPLRKSSTLCPPVHPRVGGEHNDLDFVGRLGYGSSPRGRGTPLIAPAARRSARFIPAWAGNTPCTPYARPHTTVHPRVGGEHRNMLRALRRHDGSSPRGRGTRLMGTSSLLHLTVHPRVGGEHRPRRKRSTRSTGSSPRGRGTPAERGGGHSRRRFIPAWAGNTDHRARRLGRVSVHPRVGGEHPPRFFACIAFSGSSPRGRGTPDHLNTRPLLFTVHPRVGGEHRTASLPTASCTGSSPRGRGTLQLV